MANTIRLRRGSTAPTAGSFAEGEPAWDSTNGRLYIKNAAGTMVQIGAGGGTYTVSATAPTSPANGDRWFDTDTAIEYTYVNDGNTSQWVETSAPSVIGSDIIGSADNAFTGANTFYNATGQTVGTATAANDGIVLQGRAGGTGTFRNTLVPGTLSANRTITLPDTTGTVVTTGDTGSVTSAMIATETIANTDVSLTAAIAGTKIAPDFGSQEITTSASPGLDLTGAVNAGASSQGVLAVGTLGFSGARIAASFQSSQTQYLQTILQNTSNNTNASCDFVVCNDSSTDSTNYGNFGINSSTYSGTGIFNQPGAVYLTATSGPIGIGTTTDHDIRFSRNAEATDSLTLAATEATFGKCIKPRSGTATASTAPLEFTAGTNLTVPEAGAIEYDGTYFYATPTTTSGRGHAGVFQTFRLTGNGGNIGGTIADFYGATSAINLAATSVYEIEFFAYLQKNTAGTLTWTHTASSAPTLITSQWRAGPITGIAAGTPTTLYTGSRASATAAFGASGSISNNAFMAYEFHTRVITNAATTFKLQITCSAGSVTPQAGSFYTVRQVSGTTGSFA